MRATRASCTTLLLLSILRSNRFVTRGIVHAPSTSRGEPVEGKGEGMDFAFARVGVHASWWWWPSVKSKSTSSTLGLRGGHCVVIIAISYYIWYTRVLFAHNLSFPAARHVFVCSTLSSVVRRGINKLSLSLSTRLSFFFKDTDREKEREFLLLQPSTLTLFKIEYRACFFLSFEYF